MVHVINSCLITGERISYNRDMYGFILSNVKDEPFEDCLNVATRYVLASRFHQKTVGTLTKDDIRTSKQAFDNEKEQLHLHWGPLTYLSAYRKRGVDTPCLDTAMTIKDIGKEITPLRLLQWVEAAYLSLGKFKEYQRIGASYGDFEKLFADLEEDIEELAAIVCDL